MVSSVSGSGGGASSSPIDISSGGDTPAEDTPSSAGGSTLGDGTLIAAGPSFSMPYSAPQAPLLTPGGYSGGGSGSGSTSGPSEPRATPRTADPFGVESSGSTGTGPSSSTGAASSAGTSKGSVSTPSTSPAGDTHVFNNLAGRDPDLIYAGETIKIAVNGKMINHVVQARETLSSIAAANGVTLDSLIKTNGMDRSLLGKNSADDYFTSGGPQPAPGGRVNPPPEESVPPLPTSAELNALRSNVKQLDGHGLEPGEAAEMLKLIDKAIEGKDKLTGAEVVKLGEYTKTVDAKVKESQRLREVFNPPVA